jgi:23S rRNA pseudouridine1911/1915/1917 synthase
VALNGGWSYREQVGAAAAGVSLLDYLTATRRHSTRDEWAGRLQRAEVELDGARGLGHERLHPGQTIVWHRPPWHEEDVPRAFEVIHEDEALVAVDKPSGLPTMPAGGFLQHTLLTLVRARYPGASPLHRLGRHTSGLVLFARTRGAAAGLARAWRDHEVKKTYRALGAGFTRAEMYVIDAPIGPVPHPRIGTVQAACATGKPSHSVATVLERRRHTTLFRVDITTGRPHQVRIHLAYAGHPLVGDPLYDTGGGLQAHPGLPGDGGYLLHAERLQFEHPLTGDPMSMTAPVPEALQTQPQLSQQKKKDRKN